MTKIRKKHIKSNHRILSDDESEARVRVPGVADIAFRGKQFVLTNIMLLLGTVIMALVVLVLYLHRDETKQSNAIIVQAINKTTEAQDETNYLMTLSEQDRAKLNVQMPPSLRAKIR